VSDDRDREVLADWNQRVRMIAVGAPGVAESFAVEDVDERGLVVARTDYAYHDFFAALADYNERALVTLEADVVEPLRMGQEAVYAMGLRDLDAMRSLMADDFVFVDHRSIGYPVLDREGMIAATEANADTRSRWMCLHLHGATDRGWLIAGCMWASNFGRWTPFETGIWLGVMSNGLLSRAELFADEQVDEALARFAALMSES
jgi:hypothetical protein